MKSVLAPFALSALILLFSCTDNDDVLPNIQGSYAGTFERDGVYGEVTLVLEGGHFSGTSATEKFPAICEGDYTQRGAMLDFENTCPWTAEFDWTLILSGSWFYSVSGEQLILEREGDTYTLQKQE